MATRELKIIVAFDSYEECEEFITDEMKEIYGERLYVFESNKSFLQDKKIFIRRHKSILVEL